MIVAPLPQKVNVIKPGSAAYPAFVGKCLRFLAAQALQELLREVSRVLPLLMSQAGGLRAQ